MKIIKLSHTDNLELPFYSIKFFKPLRVVIYADAKDRIKVAISEFGLSMLMLILLNHYMFIEVMRYLDDNKWFESQ